MNLPKEFLQNMKSLLPTDEYDAFVKALSEDEQTVSIRLNPAKISREEMISHFKELEKVTDSGHVIKNVPWCEEGVYLSERPQFTLDPLFHAGCYYVQEASSMFVSHIIRTFISEPVSCLDLCAAPGGKSTAALSMLPKGSKMLSNEIDRRRARILAENITKWGNPNVTVTSNAPKDFRTMQNAFDLIITDVPCSGEGMFRKDEGAIADWTPDKVKNCAALQHEILDDIWDCLKPGGLLIYSTCTFNTAENEEMVEYICSELGAEALEVPVEESWNIHPPLIGTRPCYRFMPHFTKGEGLFICIMRKIGENATQNSKQKNSNSIKGLYVLQSGIEPPTKKGKDEIPSHAMAMATDMKGNSYPRCEISKETALDYLRRMSIILPPETPKGYVILTYKNHPLGFVKNIGNRSNNLYPQEWRIRNL